METNSAAEIDLRQIEEADMELLFSWRNLPEIIDLSASRARVNWDQHQCWFHGALNEGNPVIYIILENNNPIGQIRFDLAGCFATISIYLIGENRGRGRGASLISAGIERLKIDKGGVTEIIAHIRRLNERSIRAFMAAGFKPNITAVNTEQTISEYRLRIFKEANVER